MLKSRTRMMGDLVLRRHQGTRWIGQMQWRSIGNLRRRRGAVGTCWSTAFGTNGGGDVGDREEESRGMERDAEERIHKAIRHAL